MVYRGEILKLVIECLGMSKMQVYWKLNISRKLFYNYFEWVDILFEMLIDVGKIIYYFFSDEIFELWTFQIILDLGDNYYECILVDEWKNKYIVLLEEYIEFFKKFSELQKVVGLFD